MTDLHLIPDDLRGADTRDPERLRRRRQLTVALREQGWSGRRIAEEMGVSVSTAKHRARKEEAWRRELS